MNIVPQEVYYRIEDSRIARLDANGELVVSYTVVYCYKIAVIKHTPKGVRLSNGKLVLHKHRKKYACSTIVEAKECFIARKKRHIAILQNKISAAKEAVSLVENNSFIYEIS